MATKLTRTERKAVEDPTVCYHLTGESGLSAVTLPDPPSSKAPTIIRLTHSNIYGPIDADIFVRVGDPKSPLGHTDFDTVSDWQKAALVEDTVWDDRKEEWIPRPKKIVGETLWQATYDAEIQFRPGKHLIEIKFVSPIEHVCSIVLSNWKVSAK